MSKSPTPFRRPHSRHPAARLNEPRRFLQVVAGPRQVGKSTLVQQVTDAPSVPVRHASADEPTLRGADWIEQQRSAARLDAAATAKSGSILVFDQIQKMPAWSETVKRPWDEDTRAKRALEVVPLGAAPLLISRGLRESLAGRFELLHLPHQTHAGMLDAFGWSLDQHLFHGGYPGASSLVADAARWRRYVIDSLIETSIARDALLLTRVDKPALLRWLFELASRHSGRILTSSRMLGQLQDAGSSTTLAHCLQLLASAGTVCGPPKYAGDAARSRGSTPKLQVLNTAPTSVLSGLTLAEAKAGRERRGRLVESAAGAHLTNAAAAGTCKVYHWRERNHEVDFVVEAGRRLTTIEVKSGRAPQTHAGTAAFARSCRTHRSVLVGSEGVKIEEFLLRPVKDRTGPQTGPNLRLERVKGIEPSS